MKLVCNPWKVCKLSATELGMGRAGQNKFGHFFWRTLTITMFSSSRPLETTISNSEPAQFLIWDRRSMCQGATALFGSNFCDFLDMAQPKEPPPPPACTKCGEPGKEVVWDSHLQLYRSKCSKIFVTIKNPCRPSAHEAFTKLWFALHNFSFFGFPVGGALNFVSIISFWVSQGRCLFSTINCIPERPGDGVAWEWMSVIPKLEDHGYAELASH